MSFDLGTIATLIVAIGLAVVAVVFVPFLQKEKEQTVWKSILAQVRVYVQAAEMLFSSGAEKLQYVLSMMETWLDSMKYTVDSDQLRAAVESEVYALPGRAGDSQSAADEPKDTQAGQPPATETVTPEEPLEPAPSLDSAAGDAESQGEVVTVETESGETLSVPASVLVEAGWTDFQSDQEAPAETE